MMRWANWTAKPLASLDAITREWIGWRFPPAEWAIENSQWTADETGSYCGRCGDSAGPGEATHDGGCATCRRGGELSGGIGAGVVRLGGYVSPLREWISAIKFQQWEEMATALGSRLGQQVQRAVAVRTNEACWLDPERTVVVPMPMPWQRRVYRGIDHARCIAEAAARTIEAPLAPLLRRSLASPQVMLASSMRKRPGRHEMAVRRRLGGWSSWGVEGLHVLLVDDVRTTGGTLKAAVRVLRALRPARIVCAVLAVSDSSARKARTTARDAT